MVLAGVLYATAVMLAMHWLEPEFSPLRLPISAYVLGAHGIWITSTYFVLSVSVLMLAYCMTLSLVRTSVRIAALSLYLIAASGFLLAGSFPMDLPGSVPTLSGRLHAVGGAATFPPWVLGTALFTLSLRKNPLWKNISAPLTYLAASIGVVLGMLVLSMAVFGFAGYVQRVLVALLYAWMVIAAIHIRRLYSPACGQPVGVNS